MLKADGANHVTGGCRWIGGGFSLFLMLVCVPAHSDAVRAEPRPEVRVLAEVRVPNRDNDFRWKPAGLIAQGEEVFYTVRIRNPGNTPLTALSVVRALPHNMHYVANSATGAGAEIHFSADGGQSFGKPSELRVPDDPARLIPAGQYTHIRWQLRHPLAPKAVVLARFRAIFQ
jgi:uncharacterized repeat protein (TIGR01451 family)